MTMEVSRCYLGVPLTLPVLFVLGAGAVFLLLFFVVFRGRNRQGIDSFSSSSDPGLLPEPDRESRRAVLEKLADKQITREEAEACLSHLGTPVPEEIPPAPKAGTPPAGRGCLVAVLIGAAAFVFFLFLVMLVMFWTCRGTRRAVSIPAHGAGEVRLLRHHRMQGRSTSGRGPHRQTVRFSSGEEEARP